MNTGPRTLADNEARVADLLDREWRLSIGGVGVPAVTGAIYTLTTPYGEREIAQVPDGATADAARAVEAACGPAEAWAREPVLSRAAKMMALADAIEERALDFALLDAIDGGAPIGIMQLDVTMAVEALRYFAGLGMEAKGFTVRSTQNFHFTERYPFGVVVKIVPFNHPFLFAASKIAAPLAAGNAVVLKPAEATPLSALMLGELCDQMLPRGLVSVVVGDGPEVPNALVRHPLVRRIGFTGSDVVGRAIQRSAAEVGVKNITLELGGKNALIAFPDADPVEVARGAIMGMNFTWSGQSCGSTSRLIVHEDIADEVLGHIADQLRGRQFLSPLDPAAVQGTMVNRKQFERALGYIDGAIAQGAQLVTGGAKVDSEGGGLFIQPTFLDRVAPDWPVACEEIFGPVVSVLRWTDEAEAIRIANSVDYGLTGSVFTNDIRTAHHVARALETGFVWINGAGPHYLGLPYGGWKDSGLGAEEGIDELISYTQSKSVSVLL
ncbi:aldehyde dehydrogenase family protein [Leifsonia sp. Root112D2]|uniref:aldehyde dehydrogenase family protein n=1 Tax=Leifsonia sp. Root112D2 TaxID=1736426 RepID=UPI0006F96D1A|nr:aldehyde dehydrogenase family protein [Leifsonia sp. Root112D2]KQV08290.1 aldehyde dehydrogenase [Leifsonia sp. Root112D2]